MAFGVLLTMILGVLISVAAAVGVIVASRRRAEATGPRCGKCGYNLTGAPSNRCPECGRLFIEAGVVMPPAQSASRGTVRLVLVMLVGLTVLSVLGTVVMMARTRAAVVARQAALNARAQAAAQQAATTAQAADAAEQDRLSETP